jgi:hypothetical protein
MEVVKVVIGFVVASGNFKAYVTKVNSRDHKMTPVELPILEWEYYGCSCGIRDGPAS